MAYCSKCGTGVIIKQRLRDKKKGYMVRVELDAEPSPTGMYVIRSGGTPGKAERFLRSHHHGRLRYNRHKC